MLEKIKKLESKYQKKMDRLLKDEWDRDDGEVSYLDGAITALNEAIEIIEKHSK